MIQEAKILNFRTKAQVIFDRQRAASRRRPFPTLRERLELLEKLELILTANQDAIADAISADFGHRSHHETGGRHDYE